ncbi:MAG TPA: site-specific integrase [Tissierellia bacterium]|nr:site-specific integrase [Tissierellia bacterium]
MEGIKTFHTLGVYPIGKKAEKKEDNYYDKHELKDFLELAEQDMTPLWYTYFRLLAFTAMRKSEALAFTWADVDFKRSLVTIDKTLTVGDGNVVAVGEPKTGSSMRIIYLDRKTVDILRSWRLEQNRYMSGIGYNPLNRDQLIFATKSNTHFPLSNPNHRLNNLIKKHNLKKITVHGFRHTHCSMLLNQGLRSLRCRKG